MNKAPSKTVSKKQSLYSAAHIIKRKKMLLGNVACLTNETVYQIITRCVMHIDNNFAGSYILASLFSGRSLSQLLEAKIAIPTQEVDGNIDVGFYLFSNWQHPKLALPSAYISQFQQPDSDGEILLPAELLPAFQKSRDELIQIEVLKEEVESFCKQNFNSLFQHVNPTRIQYHISHCAPKFELSRADVAFITDSKLKDNPHCSYGLFNARSVIQKHICYIGSLTTIARLSGFEVFAIDKNSSFGSHRVLKESTLKEFFEYCVGLINRNPTTQTELIQSFNFYTLYVVSILELCTMHRPILSEFGKLENFDLISGNVLIRDKGDHSYRVVPLCKTGCAVVNAYLKYLKNIRTDLQFIYPEIAHDIAETLSNNSSLFKWWDHKGIKPYNPKQIYPQLESLFPFPFNWARHYVATVLMNENVSRNDLEFFMGHAPAPDHIYSPYSSFDFNSYRILSDKIEMHLTQELNLLLIL
jgi:hypothetical protein